jgi:hypothetical protein
MLFAQMRDKAFGRCSKGSSSSFVSPGVFDDDTLTERQSRQKRAKVLSLSPNYGVPLRILSEIRQRQRPVPPSNRRHRKHCQSAEISSDLIPVRACEPLPGVLVVAMAAVV